MEKSGVPRRRALKAAIAAERLKYFHVAERVGISQGHLSNILNDQRDATDDVLDQIEAAIAELIGQPAAAS